MSLLLALTYVESSAGIGAPAPQGAGSNKKKISRIHPRYIYEEADEPEAVEVPGVPASVVKAKTEVQKVTEKVAALFNVTAMPPECNEDDDEVILLML